MLRDPQSIYPPFDPELETAIQAARDAFPPLTSENLAAVRAIVANGDLGAPQVDLTAGGRISVDERTVPGLPGDPDVTLLILTPAEGTGPWPAIYYVHGGGMVLGHRRSNVEAFIPYAAEGKAVVISVEYRLAPEHPDPAPVEDCYAGLKWAAETAAPGRRATRHRRLQCGGRTGRRHRALGSRPRLPTT